METVHILVWWTQKEKSDDAELSIRFWIKSWFNLLVRGVLYYSMTLTCTATVQGLPAFSSLFSRGGRRAGLEPSCNHSFQSLLWHTRPPLGAAVFVLLILFPTGLTFFFFYFKEQFERKSMCRSSFPQFQIPFYGLRYFVFQEKKSFSVSTEHGWDAKYWKLRVFPFR